MMRIKKLRKKYSSAEEKLSKLKRQDISQKGIIKICKKISIQLEILEKILSLQIPYWNKSGLGFEKEKKGSKSLSKG